MAITEYGDPDVLQLMDLPDPLVGPDSVLVRARAASVNPVDTKVRAGYLQGAFASHFPLVPGWDVAGVVEAFGPAVTIAVGDEVMGYVRRDEIQHGTYAELVSAPLRTVARKPATASSPRPRPRPPTGSPRTATSAASWCCGSPDQASG